MSDRLCIAVGHSNIPKPLGLSSVMLIERWDGSRWTIQHTPGFPAFSSDLFGVSCASQSACMAVGVADDEALAVRFDGIRWSIRPIPAVGSAATEAFDGGVSCASERTCTAVGNINADAGGSSAPPVEPLVERWNGHRWFLQRTPATPNLSTWLGSVSCGSVTSCFALGTTNAGALVERYS